MTPDAKVALPARHSMRADQLLILSDFKLPTDHPLIRDLIVLRRQVFDTLRLSPGTKQVMVYLFSNELEYRKYWKVTYPEFPMRRAYFVQTPGRELAVYTFWGDRIQEDLRHEFTHGLLHSRLENVPLWLDEGLAEYFEVAGPAPGGLNGRSADVLALALQRGWRPDLERLERMEKVDQMQRLDYQESWVWVHYLLHGPDDSRAVLANFMQDLRTDPHAGPLSARLKQDLPQPENRLAMYIASLSGTGGHLAVPASTAAVTPAGHAQRE